MKDLLLTYARYIKDADLKVYGILDGLTQEEREADRGSYYGSLSGLVLHLLGGTRFFHSLFKSALPEASSGARALAYPDIALPQGGLTEVQWKSLKPSIEILDEATIRFISALEEEDFKTPVQVPFYQGNPPAAPLSFLFQQMVNHGIHHRGQISQVLDEMKVDNDYSAIDLAFLSP
jgi:uncharacterized damage-inducible protein DinB